MRTFLSTAAEWDCNDHDYCAAYRTTPVLPHAATVKGTEAQMFSEPKYEG